MEKVYNKLAIYKHMLPVVKELGQSTILLEKLIENPLLQPEDLFDELIIPKYFYNNFYWLDQ